MPGNVYSNRTANPYGNPYIARPDYAANAAASNPSLNAELQKQQAAKAANPLLNLPPGASGFAFSIDGGGGDGGFKYSGYNPGGSGNGGGGGGGGDRRHGDPRTSIRTGGRGGKVFDYHGKQSRNLFPITTMYGPGIYTNLPAGKVPNVQGGQQTGVGGAAGNFLPFGNSGPAGNPAPAPSPATGQAGYNFTPPQLGTPQGWTPPSYLNPNLPIMPPAQSQPAQPTNLSGNMNLGVNTQPLYQPGMPQQAQQNLAGAPLNLSAVPPQFQALAQQAGSQALSNAGINLGRQMSTDQAGYQNRAWQGANGISSALQGLLGDAYGMDLQQSLGQQGRQYDILGALLGSF